MANTANSWHTHEYSRYDSDECDECCECGCSNDDRCSDCLDCCAPHKPKQTVPAEGWTTKGGSKMTLNSTIAKMYDKTDDALLVNDYYGGSIPTGSDIHVIVYKPHAKAILEAAQAKKAEAEAAKNVVRAKITE